jgi:CelD/BcsL family acetyltransferase involved in cellulose biosynthesis
MKVELRSSFAGLEDPWEALRAQSNANHVFSSFGWQSTWWSTFGAGYDLHLILVWDADELAAVAPFYRDGTTLRLIGGADLSDYLDLIYRPDGAAPLFEAVGNHLAEAGQLGLDLCSLPAESPTVGYLSSLAERVGCRVTIADDDVCPAIDLPADWDTYLAGLTKKDRHELRRKLRRLEANHSVRHYRVEGLPAIRASWPDFFRLQALTRPEKAAFQTAENRRFFEQLAEALYPRGWFQLHFLEVDGARVSAVICFDQPDELWLYNSGYDPEYRHLSVGLLLKALCLREAVAAGKRRFDFLRGREPYKYDLGAKDRLLYRVQVMKVAKGS